MQQTEDTTSTAGVMPEFAAMSDAAPAPDPTIVHMPLYRRGTPVQYQGQTYTVEHVVVSRLGLQVHLQELGSNVPAEKVYLAPSRLVLRRS